MQQAVEQLFDISPAAKPFTVAAIRERIAVWGVGCLEVDDAFDTTEFSYKVRTSRKIMFG